MFIEGNGSYLCSNTEDLSVKTGEGSNTIPQFAMPFAPLGIGSTFLYHSVLKDDDPKADLDFPLKGITNDTEISSIEQGQKSVSSDDSSEDHFHTCPDQSLPSSCGDSDDPSIKDSRRKTENIDTCDISKEHSKLLLLTRECFMVSENKRVAYVTLDLDEPRDFTFGQSLQSFSNHANMPHKTSKASLDVKTRSKHKEKSGDQQHENQTKIKDNLFSQSQAKSEFISEKAGCEDRAVTVIETIVITEKITPKTQVKKKKKHTQHGAAKHENDLPTEVCSRTTQESANGKTENADVKLASNGLNKPASHLPTRMDPANTDSTQNVMPVRPKVEVSLNIVAKMDPAGINTNQKAIHVKLKADTSGSNVAKMENKICGADPQSTHLLNDDIKRRRIANDLSGAIPIKTRPQLPAIFRQARKDGQDTSKRSYSEVVKQKTPPPKEVVVPRVVSEIQADPVPDDPQNISLWCQVSPVLPDVTIKWTKEGTVLSESRKGVGDSDRFTLTIKKACSKDLGLYKCSMTSSDISVSTAEYHLTSEVLMELVIPSHDQPAEPRILDGEEESIQCSPLLFKEDFLSDQYFGENQAASILTEKVHFGEGMHRKAFRTMLRAGKLPCFNPGHPCVLKVHNAIGYGTKNNEELVQKNYSLAVEECHVQNTAREYIKAYNSVAKSAESFGEVPEIIPIYLVHRPSNNIPYATLEEELLGDFVKYSVKDGKEINLMRRDSEAGQKCCAFQHWVYTQTEGNLLVTDMQGVGMKLTDVGIATCKKGYKGFRGNCATSFIDQFKALHQCNRYCELLGLTSLQPKPKRTFVSAKPKAQPVPKKKIFGPVLNGKS
ncbi:alpha-protein kinase 2 [Myxocyprinus asiaticus]|uniref:alpha-protein kinase 2 n=1 Tax=Myxocyprinus asiaticus TaxID=70543 RepID=UPI0022231746|nr:alpha-protein kinase 2 [Myxocyprinus asiaticus]